MTFGVCEGSRDDNIDFVISRTDKRLYKGKNSGKNKVVASPDFAPDAEEENI